MAQTSGFPMGIEIERAEGVYLFDTSGRQYLDLISGIGVSNLGHGDPDVVKAVKDQAEKYMHTMVFGEFILSPQVRFAEAVIESAGTGFDSVFFVNSGSEAVEGALKLAKKFTGRKELIGFENSYHGSSHGALSVTGSDERKKGFGPFLPLVRHLQFNNFSDLSRITRHTAAVIFEPIQGEAGVILPESGFLSALEQRCRATGTLLIADEIQTGFGRTGTLFAFQDYGLQPDILLIGKAAGGGMPLGAFISRKEIMNVLTSKPVLGHITTFGGHPVCCAAGLAALEKIRRLNLPERAWSLESLIRKKLVHKNIKEVRGKGLMFAVELESAMQVQQVISNAMENGVILDWFLHRGTAIRIAPPLVISEEELEGGLEVAKMFM